MTQTYNTARDAEGGPRTERMHEKGGVRLRLSSLVGIEIRAYLGLT